MKILLIISAFVGVVLLGGCTTRETKNYITNNTGPKDWQPPTVSWTTPPESQLRGTVGIDVGATDRSGVDSVTLYVDGLREQALDSVPYRFDVLTDSLEDGVHLCEARAWDQYGNLGVSPILRVHVQNQPLPGPRLLWVPDSFATIQAAINAATDFDTIRVRDGIFMEALNLFGKGVWMESERGPLYTILSAGGLTNTMFVPPSSIPATIRGFALTGAPFNVLFLDDGGRLDVFNSIFVSDTSADSSYTLLFTGFCGGHFVNNLFLRSKTAIQLAGVVGTFENNIVQGAWHVGLWNSAIAGNSVLNAYNAYWQNSEDYFNLTRGVGEFDANPMIDLVNGRLSPGSPCIDSGDPDILDLDGTRSDIGPFGGPLGYR